MTEGVVTSVWLFASSVDSDGEFSRSGEESRTMVWMGFANGGIAVDSLGETAGLLEAFASAAMTINVEP